MQFIFQARSPKSSSSDDKISEQDSSLKKSCHFDESLKSDEGSLTPVPGSSPYEQHCYVSGSPEAISSLRRKEELIRTKSPKEGLIESSSDSSSSTIKSVKISSLMLDETIDQKMNEADEKSVLQHTSLDALADQLHDCQFISEAVEKYLVSLNYF